MKQSFILGVQCIIYMYNRIYYNFKLMRINNMLIVLYKSVRLQAVFFIRLTV